jgi:peptidyl-dipeptidase A
MIRTQYLLLLLVTVLVFSSCSEKEQTEKLLRYFLDKHEERIKPINKTYYKTMWATYSGETSFNELLKESNRTDSLYLSGDTAPKYYQNLLNSLYDNPSEFELLEKIEKSGLITDPLLKREFGKVFRNYISIKNNWDEAEERKTELLDKFYDLKKRENSYFDSLLSEPANNRSAKWIGEFSALTGDFREMVKALNRDVKPLGYANYFEFLMNDQEISINSIEQIINSVEQITRDDYKQLLEVCRSGMSKQECNTGSDLTPYQFRCAHSKMLFPNEWNRIIYTHESFIELLSSFYASGGFEIDRIYEKSDIWFDMNKINNSFFFCVDFDEADFRIYSNSEPIAQITNTLLHEFSHALHYQSVDRDIPYFLKTPHSIIAEAVGLYFDSKIFTSEIVQAQLGLPCLEKNPFFHDFNDPSRLMFLRKLIRNISFEKSIFENPDQDYNELWWKLSKEYLFIDPAPADRLPEWMTSFNIIGTDGINVNYLFAIAYAAQLEYYFPDDKFAPIKEKVMKYGDSIPWYELIRLSTGEPLNLEYLRKSYRRTHQHELITSTLSTRTVKEI